MKIRVYILAIATTAYFDVAAANSDGAPWGAVNPDAEQSCVSCHFDHKEINDSANIALDGLPQSSSFGQVYELTLKVSDLDNDVAGFSMAASGGTFEANAEFIEARGNEVRSTQPMIGNNKNWTLKWRAEENGSDEVKFYVAINDANNDLSPFGDRIHFKSFTVRMKNQ